MAGRLAAAMVAGVSESKRAAIDQLGVSHTEIQRRSERGQQTSDLCQSAPAACRRGHRSRRVVHSRSHSAAAALRGARSLVPAVRD